MKKLLIAVAVIALLLLAGGAVLVPMLARQALAKSSAWQTEKVDRGELEISVSASGSVEPLQVVQVGSQVSGKVKEVLVELDQRVKKGQTLAALDTELLESERKDRESQLKHARIALEMLAVERGNLDLREKDLKLNLERERIASERAHASLELATKNLQRYQDLIKADATTPTELDIKALEHRNADLEARGKKVDLARLAMELERIGADRRSLDSREGQTRLNIEQAEQALAKAATNLGYASIVAPIDGIVLERGVEPGQTIAAQFQTPNLFKIIADLSTVKVLSNIDEADVGRIHPGQQVRFEVDAFRGETFTGSVKAVNLKHELRSNLVTYPVAIEAANPASAAHPYGKLRPGMTAYVIFEVERKKDVLRLPAAALRFVPPEGADVEQPPSEPAPAAGSKEKPAGMPATVYLAKPGGGLKAVHVRVGENDGKYYELLAGSLKPGDEAVMGMPSIFEAAVKVEAK